MAKLLTFFQIIRTWILLQDMTTSRSILDSTGTSFPENLPSATISLFSEDGLNRLRDLSGKFSRICNASVEVFLRSQSNCPPASISELNNHTSFVETSHATLANYDRIISDINVLCSALTSQQDEIQKKRTRSYLIPWLSSELFDLDLISGQSRTVFYPWSAHLVRLIVPY